MNRLLDRTSLYLTAGFSVAVMLLAPASRGAGALLGEPAESEPHGSSALHREASERLRANEALWGESPAGRAGRHQERVALRGREQLRAAFGAGAPLEAEGFGSCLVLPLAAQGELQGVLELFHRGPLPEREAWPGFLETLATQAAIALHNVYETTIEGWARVGLEGRGDRGPQPPRRGDGAGAGATRAP